MIRVAIDKDDLRDLINSHKNEWLENAKAKTDELEADPTKKVTSIWSPIKEVFTILQHSKCIFCEKEMENQSIEQDVEHFRPKNNVKRWKPPQWMIDDEGITSSQPSTASEAGYRLLAYNFLNYAAACKYCNSTRKSDLFPIAGSRMSGSKNPVTMKSEKAYLIYPISDFDDDPEDLIEFFGLSPQAKQESGMGRKRALITIEIFQLDDINGRPFLFKKRAKNIWLLFNSLKMIEEGNAEEQSDGQKVADFMTSPASEHTNCMKCYRQLFQENRAEAEIVAKKALVVWTSSSP